MTKTILNENRFYDKQEFAVKPKCEEYINEIGKIYNRPWGSYQTIALADDYQIKIITINPGGRLSLQKHTHRSEHWLVIKGLLLITIGNEIKNYQVGDKVFIDKEVVHRAENITQEPATIVEVQLGTYLGEDDIIRLEDFYGRV